MGIDEKTGEVRDDAKPEAAKARKEDKQNAAMVLAPNDGVGFNLELEPRDLASLFTLATTLAKTGICKVASPEDVIVRALAGRDLGLTMMQSLRGIYVVHGRPSIAADVLHALCLRDPTCEEFDCVFTDRTKATYRVKVRGKPAKEISFTIEQAREAGLLDRGDTPAAKAADAWQTWRAEKLRARCKTTVARMEFPHVGMGLYTQDELREMPRPPDSDEMIGEVIPNDPPKVAVVRDWERETAELCAFIADPPPGTTVKMVRERITAWRTVGATPPEQYNARVLAAYETKAASARNARAAPKSDPDAADKAAQLERERLEALAAGA
jgi:hypothetical protein